LWGAIPGQAQVGGLNSAKEPPALYSLVTQRLNRIELRSLARG
jgi:hypothetical protein